MIQVICEKTPFSKGFLAIWDIFFNENNCDYNSYRLSYKFAFILFLYFLQTKSKNPVFTKLVI